ncbi:hypothetical protein [Calothrix sp. 336/3]|uniref:hypothetical protein n=1 Tax=Calothrix sp. 336/3 TaxID=1337936 RepID=UPI0004E33766|nr:hypothetical protein [Calothrix sp. 336/3]AKG23613.1 hypothetical protein IJ00_22070 [Calothrix sp. 336/3]
MTSVTIKQRNGDQIPKDVQIRNDTRKPVMDPTLGIPVKIEKVGTPINRLVAIGDSLTHGFQSGAIYYTRLSYPAIIARELGWRDFRYPTYESPQNGIPLNLESLARNLGQKYGNKINWWNLITTTLSLRQYLGVIEDYWERGAGSSYPVENQINHNLAVYGWDLRNTISRNADICLDILRKNPGKNDFLRQVVTNHNERAAIRVLNAARDANKKALSPLQAAAVLGSQGNEETEGIETLIVLIGSNNALGSVLTFNVAWSGDGYDDMVINDKYTVWRPMHFKAELDILVKEIRNIRARHVIFGTVPHVTIAPFAKGVGEKVRRRSRYFPYYTLPWIKDEDFNPEKHPHLLENEVRAIDSAIDQYNDYIADAVQQARIEGKDWYLFEAAGLLDRLASRRYIEDPDARPDWWDEVGGEYKLPPELEALSPVPTSRFYRAGAQGRTQGGLFSLDGIHPTTIGYGIMAQEIIKIMQLAGVKFYDKDGTTERQGEVKVDFQRLISEDSLITEPPRIQENVLEWIGGIDKNFNLISGMLTRNF